MNSHNSTFNPSQAGRGQWVSQIGTFSTPIDLSQSWLNVSNDQEPIFRQTYNAASSFQGLGPNTLLHPHPHQSGTNYTMNAHLAPVDPGRSFAPEASSSKSPTLANILQFDGAEQIPAPSQPSMRDQPRRRRPRGTRVSQKDWEKYKDYIRKLWLEDEKTLLEIKHVMERDFKFVASEQVYKNKLVEWGFSKNIPRGLPDDVSQWILVKDEEREQDGKKTEYKYKNHILPLLRVKESAKRLEPSRDLFIAETPQGLTYYTPRNCEPTLPSPFRISSVSPHRASKDQSRWAPAPGDPSTHHGHLRLTWKGYNHQELEEMRADAKTLSNLERFEEAEHKLREALAGFEYLLSATHEETLSVGYELAELYAHHTRMVEADSVLDWLTEQLFMTWGPTHRKYIAHLVRITDLFHKWSRTSEAVTMLLRATHLFDTPDTSSSLPRDEDKGDSMNAPPIPRKRVQEKSDTMISRVIDLSDIGGHKDSTGVLEFQLRIANAQVRDQDEGAESLLLDLLEQCEKFPDMFEAQMLKAHASLIDLYHTLEKPEELDLALAAAQKCFTPIMKKPGHKTISLLDSAIDLAGLFVKVGKYKEADDLFYRVEKAVGASCGDDEIDNEIDFLVDIGMLYQKYDRWNNARERFEHALALSLAARGPESLLSKRLQAALDNRRYSMSSLPTVEYKSSLRKRLMG